MEILSSFRRQHFLGIYAIIDDHFCYVNPELARLLGYTQAELLAFPDPTRLIHSEDWNRVGPLIQARREGRVSHVDYRARVVRKDGSVVTVEVHGGRGSCGGKEALTGLVLDVSALADAEEQIRESQSRFRAITEQSLDITTVLDAQGVVTYVSPSIRDVLGWETEDLLGRNSLELLHPNDVPRLRELLAGVDADSDAQARLEYRYRHQDGTWRTLEAQARNLLHDDAVQGIVVVARDVSEQRETETRLREAESLFRLLTEASRDLTLVVDRKGTPKYVSPSVHDLLGYTQEEFMRLPPESMVHPDDQEAISQANQRTLRGENASQRLRFRIRHKSGAWRWLEGRGSMLHREGDEPEVAVHSRDITEQVAAEQDLAEAERRFRALTENAQDITTIIDSTGIVTFQSPAVERVTGWSPEELVGTKVFDPIHPEDRPLVEQLFASVMAQPGRRADAEYRYQCRDNSYRCLQSLAVNLLDDPSVGGVVVHSRDITEKKAAEARLAQAEARYRSLVDNSLDLVMVIDREHCIHYASPSVETILGRAPTDFSQHSLKDYTHPDDWPRVLDRLEKRAAGTAPNTALAYRLRHANGTWRLVEGRGVNLLQDPSVSGIVVYSHDVTELKEAYAALERSEQMNRSVLDSMVAAIAVVDPRGRIVSVNSSWVEFGEQNGLVPGKGGEGDNYLEVCRRSKTADAQVALAGITEVLAGKLARFEMEYACPSPTESRWFLMHVTPLQGGTHGAVITHLNITERRQAEEALAKAAKAQRELAEIINRSPVVAFSCRAEPDWPIEFASENVSQFGYSAAEFVEGRISFATLTHPDDLARVSGEVQEWTQSGASEFHQEYRILTREGEARWVSDITWIEIGANGKPSHYKFVLVDITARKEAEARVKETAENLHRLIDASPLAIISLDNAGLVREWNEAAERTFGWSRGEVVGQPYSLVPPEEQDSYQASRQMAQSGETVPAHYSKRYRKDGVPVDVRVSKAPIIGPGGDISGVIAILEDVSESRIAQQFQELLSEVNQLLLTTAAGEAALRLLCERTVDIANLRLAWIGFKEANGAVRVGAAAGEAIDYLKEIDVRWDDSPQGQGPTGLAISTGREHRRSMHEVDYGPWRERAQRFSLGESLCMPLFGPKGAFGALNVYSKNRDGIPENVAAHIRTITGQIAMVLLRAEEQQLLRLHGVALDSAANAVFITDSEGKITWVNRAFTQLSGYEAEEVMGETPRVLKSGVHSQDYYELLWQTIRSGQPFRSEVTDRHKSGAHYVVAQTVTPLVDADGKVTHFVAIHEDVTARREAEARVRYLAQHDPLTGLPNRVYFRERLELSLQQARFSKQPVLLLFMDLDHFKTVNDTLGHDAGDELLREVARRCTTCIRAGDTFSRLGGDEFTIILADASGPEAGARVAEKLIQAFAPPFSLRDRSLYVTPSIGISTFPEDADSADDLLRAADAAMYRAKQLGRNSYHFFTQSLNEEVQTRFLIENGLREALDRGHLELFYQPEIDLKTHQPFALEALIRWRHPERGIISPLEFIPIAEEVGLIAQIGDWVLRSACEQGVRWQKAGLPPIVISVNVSFKQTRHRDMAGDFARIIADTGYDPHYLALELTEDALLDDQEETSRWILELRKLGIQFWIDDFGTGYSSLSSLVQLPLDALKIDRSFTAELGKDERSDNLVRTIIAMSHGMRLQIVAEGVETVEQRDQLAAEGCEFGQGYLWSKPSPPAEIEKFLASFQ